MAATANGPGRARPAGAKPCPSAGLSAPNTAACRRAGAAAAAVIRGEATLSIGLPPRQSVPLVDAGASPTQRRAAEALLRDKFAFFLGRILRVIVTPMTVDVQEQGAHLAAPGLRAVDVPKAVLPDDALPGATRWYALFVPLKDAQLGTRVLNRLSARNFRFTWNDAEPATSGYYGRFIFYPR